MKKRKNNYQPPKNLPPRNPFVPSPPGHYKGKEDESFVGGVKFLFCGPKENPEPLTFGVFLRRFFIVLDNLIAAALLYYVLTWIKFYSNGADTSFDVIIDDMTTLCFNNAEGFFFVLIVTWRWLYYSDSLPCLRNFTYRLPYGVCAVFVVSASLWHFMCWLSMLMSCGFDLDAMTQPPEWVKHKYYDYLPYWAQVVRSVILGVVFMIRRLMFNDIDMEYGRKLFERNPSKSQQTTDAQDASVRKSCPE